MKKVLIIDDRLDCAPELCVNYIADIVSRSGEPQTADEEHTWKLAAQMLDDLKHNVFPGLMEDCPDDNGADIFKPISSNEVSDDLVNVKNTTDVPTFVVKDGELASKE